MKKIKYSFSRTKLTRILIVFLTFSTTTLMAQPTSITVTGCNAGAAINGVFTLNAGVTACNSCTSYERDGGGVFIFRTNVNTTVWSGTTNPINCNTLPYAMQSGESDCDPTNGGTSVNGCVIVETPLPVEMMWFEAEHLLTRSVRLRWEVASEWNNEGFEIERSTDGTSFSTIGFVRGRGTASSAMEYNYDDRDLATGKVYYYRLRQIDFDGQSESSRLVTILLKGENSTLGEFFPNPSTGSATIDLFTKEQKEWNMEAIDLAGRINFRVTHQLSIGDNRIELDLSSLETGLYIMKFESGDEQIYRKLSIKKN